MLEAADSAVAEEEEEEEGDEEEKVEKEEKDETEVDREEHEGEGRWSNDVTLARFTGSSSKRRSLLQPLLFLLLWMWFLFWLLL